MKVRCGLEYKSSSLLKHHNQNSKTTKHFFLYFRACYVPADVITDCGFALLLFFHAFRKYSSLLLHLLDIILNSDWNPG